MGYHPESLVCGFPHYKSWLAPLKPWIGFDIWHIDPERRCEGQRTDDSCGWFDRRPREYADAVAYLLADKDFMHEVSICTDAAMPMAHAYGHVFPRMRPEVTLTACLMVARELETRRWWNGQNGKPGMGNRQRWPWSPRKRHVADVAMDLALTCYDNLSSTTNPEVLIRQIASALHRRFRPWWRHPRWHVHHWQINFDLVRNLKRMFQPCGTCRRPLGFGCCPISDSQGLHHMFCRGGVAAVTQPESPCPN